MGDGLKRVAKQCGGLTATSRNGKKTKFDAAGRVVAPKKLLDQESAAFQRKANALARSYVSVHQCKKCGDPYIEGYCCGSCGTGNPRTTDEEDAEYERRIAAKQLR